MSAYDKLLSTLGQASDDLTTAAETELFDALTQGLCLPDDTALALAQDIQIVLDTVRRLNDKFMRDQRDQLGMSVPAVQLDAQWAGVGDPYYEDDAELDESSSAYLTTGEEGVTTGEDDSQEYDEDLSDVLEVSDDASDEGYEFTNEDIIDVVVDVGVIIHGSLRKASLMSLRLSRWVSGVDTIRDQVREQMGGIELDQAEELADAFAKRLAELLTMEQRVIRAADEPQDLDAEYNFDSAVADAFNKGRLLLDQGGSIH